MWTFHNKMQLYSEELLTPCPTPKLEEVLTPCPTPKLEELPFLGVCDRFVHL